jgi:hypothetical protein
MSIVTPTTSLAVHLQKAQLGSPHEFALRLASTMEVIAVQRVDDITVKRKQAAVVSQSTDSCV